MSLIAAIVANPDDDVLRLVYADWLDDQGDVTRAEFVRGQVTLTQLDSRNPTVPLLEDRTYELLSAHERDWLGFDPTTADAPIAWQFTRGFLNSVELTQQSLAMGADWLALHPVAELEIAADEDDTGDLPTDRELPLPSLPALEVLKTRSLAGVEFAERLIRSGTSPRLRSVQFWPNSGHDFSTLIECAAASAPQLEALAGWSGFEGGLGGNFIPNFVQAASKVRLRSFAADVAPADFAPALAAEALSSLQSLGLLYDPSGDDAGDNADNYIAALTQALRDAHPKLRLHKLDGKISYALSAAAAARLLAVPALKELRTLEAHIGYGNADFAQALVAAPLWHHARALDLSFYEDDCDELCATLARTPGGSDLHDLMLWPGVGVGAAGLAAIAAAPWAGTLTRLALKLEQAGRTNALTMVGNAPFDRLRTLSFCNSKRYDDPEFVPVTDARALAESPTLARLRSLSLTDFSLGIAGVEALLNGRYTLSALNLRDCVLPAEVGSLLAAWPKLARLNRLDLSDNPDLGGDALLPLAESPYLSPLCEVNLRRVNPSTRVRAALSARQGRRGSE